MYKNLKFLDTTVDKIWFLRYYIIVKKISSKIFYGGKNNGKDY